jgi:hypothetical protein
MTRLFPLLLLALLLVGCAPLVTSAITGGAVPGTYVVSIQTTSSQYLEAGVIIDGLDLATADDRCAVSRNPRKLACDLGNLPAGSITTIVVTSSVVPECLADGYTGPNPFTNYLQARCTVNVGPV